MKRWGKQRETYFDEKELKTDLGTGNFIFIGSSCDMWANSIKPDWIFKTLFNCTYFFQNKYLFQTKNPKRINTVLHLLPENSVLGTTIETNRVYPQMGKTVAPTRRAEEMQRLSMVGFETMITIEPIFDFDMVLVDYIRRGNPKWVNIGADSGGHKLPEPPAGKVRELIAELLKFTEVKLKKNLNRILNK